MLIFAADILILGRTRRKVRRNEVNGTSLYKKKHTKIQMSKRKTDGAWKEG
jgi:hypothetical protein